MFVLILEVHVEVLCDICAGCQCDRSVLKKQCCVVKRLSKICVVHLYFVNRYILKSEIQTHQPAFGKICRNIVSFKPLFKSYKILSDHFVGWKLVLLLCWLAIHLVSRLVEVNFFGK
jgi:hypothetical protein